MDTEEDDLFRCAICGTAEGDSSNLSSQTSLQTNATVRCGHQFCNSCLDRELARKREFPCPICKTAVKRVNLTSRSLDHVQCEKDTSWRRRILSVFNKTEKGKEKRGKHERKAKTHTIHTNTHAHTQKPTLASY